MSTEIVRGELERLFSLEELLLLSDELLGFSPDDVGGTASKASFAKALLERCSETNSTLALIDAMVGSRPDLDARVRELLRTSTPDPELKAGATFGRFTIQRKIADGPRGTTYAAKRDGEDRILRVLRRDLTAHPGVARRFLASTRILARVESPNLPQGLDAGTVGDQVFVSYKLSEAQPLSARIGRSGALHLNEAKPLLKGEHPGGTNGGWCTRGRAHRRGCRSAGRVGHRRRLGQERQPGDVAGQAR
jgi:hypothetical protein